NHRALSTLEEFGRGSCDETYLAGVSVRSAHHRGPVGRAGARRPCRTLIEGVGEPIDHESAQVNASLVKALFDRFNRHLNAIRFRVSSVRTEPEACIERFFQKVKHFRRIATRYEKTAI